MLKAETKSYQAIADQYITDVLDGTILVCRWVRLAYARHKKDLEASQNAKYPYKYNAAKGERVCRFIEMLPHVKGKWAAAKHRLVLQPWQIAITMVLFSWVEKETEFRRFRTAYVSVPRKNGKSIWAAAIALYMLALDGEQGAECYSGATTLKQAKEVFTPARQMVIHTKELRERLGIEPNAQSLVRYESGSKFEPVIGRGKDGSSPSLFICDEYHQQDTDELMDSMVTGMGARQQPLALITTTSGFNNMGPCKMMQDDVQNVLEGTLDQEELFGIIYTLDAEDDWTTEEALLKANPNAGISVELKFLKSQQKIATQSSAKQNAFKVKHMNIWVNACVSWMNMEAWANAATDEITDEFVKDAECYIGLDLASKVDMAAAVKVFRKLIDGKMHYYIVPRLYLPKDRVQDPTKQHYQMFMHNGYLTVTDGAEIDFQTILADLLEDAKKYNVKMLCFDPDNATDITQQFESLTNVQRIEVPQTVRYMSEPMKLLESGVANKTIHHNNNLAMNWMMSNVIARLDFNDNIKPNKQRPENKIDGPVAAINALSQAFTNQVPEVKKTMTYQRAIFI